MPLFTCPCDWKDGPIGTATETGYGLSIARAIQSAIENAKDKADDDCIEKIGKYYRCKPGCVIGYSGNYNVIGVPRYTEPPFRAWWTFWIFYRAEVTMSITRAVKCFRIETQNDS